MLFPSRRCVLLLCLLATLPGLASNAQTNAQPSIAQRERDAQLDLAGKHPELAIREFEAIVAAQPDNLAAQANLGVLLFFAGRFQQAAGHLRRAVELDPAQAKIRALLGSCEHQLGDLAAARTDLLAALPGLIDNKVHKQDGLEIIEIDTALGDLNAAGAVADGLRAAFPTDPEVLYAGYNVHRSLADEEIIQLSLVAPNSPQLHQAMAHELMRAGDTAGAIANMRLALAANPRLPGGHYDLGEMLRQSSQQDLKAEAEAEYKAGLAQDPTDAKSLIRLGDLDSHQGDNKDAIASYRQALALQPENSDALLGLAYSLDQGGQPQEALPLLEKVIAVDPSDLTAHYRLSGVYRRLHRPEDAKREIAQFERLKAEKDKLRSVYDAMRIAVPRGLDAAQK